jgi:hypothetical protein
VSALVAGPYRVEVDYPGFQTFVQTSLVIEVGQTLAVDALLNLAQQSDTARLRPLPRWPRA